MRLSHSIDVNPEDVSLDQEFKNLIEKKGYNPDNKDYGLSFDIGMQTTLELKKFVVNNEESFIFLVGEESNYLLSNNLKKKLGITRLSDTKGFEELLTQIEREVFIEVIKAQYGEDVMQVTDNSISINGKYDINLFDDMFVWKESIKKYHTYNQYIRDNT